MIRYIIGGILFIVWAFLLRILRKSDLKYWHFILGAGGIFVLLFVFLEPVLTQPLARIVALLAGIPGKIFGIYGAYYKYGVIFVETGSAAISLRIDFECSGIIEILAYLSLLMFYQVYTKFERIYVGILGTVAIVLANAVRVILICLVIYWGGVDAYYVAHTFVGRIVFYAFTIVLYFYVFTKPQILKQKVGSFRYDNH